MRVCPECGAEVGPGMKFCAECGTKLESGQSTVSYAPSFGEEVRPSLPAAAEGRPSSRWTRLRARRAAGCTT